MANNQVLQMQGGDVVAYARLLENAATESASLIPGQTSFEFDPQRDSDSTTTKDGAFQTSSSLETDVEVDFINNTSVIADQMYDALLNNKVMELWAVHRSRTNAEGKFYAWYMQGTVSEDDNSNDADDISERDVSFAINGVPKRGWLALSADQKEEIDYIFRGLDKVTDNNGIETNGGTDWAKTDEGIYIPSTAPKSVDNQSLNNVVEPS
ncbi:phage major tail protein, TP901-1 family [Bombilactobacillus folatiphilus]|uniref:Phage major tail protein, TP901-1 family n=1 Tax=Bombilactobacillus folatiphilus TaxID=2923362 RepID=A0ABY4PAB1_9LACO|nr:phage major tail protein, TP901-1 family [Bombilactobacillus folatiphilus]UQS82607.1 phage major tail protein, TP901-1 family [Bombilactobacillus folatiphilus]